MTTLLIPDSGPLFSLAAGGLLDLLNHFKVGITDVVKQETIDRGALPQASVEAKRIHDFYQAGKAHVEILPTQVRRDLRTLRDANPDTPTPPNVGELSIQSLLIHLQVQAFESRPLVLFEDSWFLRNAAALAKPCIALSTQAFLVNAQALGWLASAEAAREAIAKVRPMAFGEAVALPGGTSARRGPRSRKRRSLRPRPRALAPCAAARADRW